MSETSCRFIRFLDKGTGVVDMVYFPCAYPIEWTEAQVKEDIEKDVPFVRILEVSHKPIAGWLGKIVPADPAFAEIEVKEEQPIE